MSELNRLIASVAYGSTASSTAVLYGPARLTQFELALDAMQPWMAEANAHGDGVFDVACCHYAIRTLMAQAATHSGHDPDRVSFVAALRITRQTIAHPGAFPP